MPKEKRLPFSLFSPCLKAGCLYLLLSVFSGCSFHEKELSHLSAQEQFLEIHKTSLSGKTQKDLSWRQAKELLLKNNLSLHRGRRQVQQAQKDRKQYWREYIPGISGRSNINTRLNELNSLSLNSFSLGAFLSLKVPNPVTIGGEMQARTLNEYRSEVNYTLAERRALKSLYSTFLRYEQIIEKLKETDSHSLPEIGELANSQELNSHLTRKKQDVRSKELFLNQLEKLSRELSFTLQTPHTHWRPLTETLPALKYHENPAKVINDNDYGKLAVKLLASNLEGARLRVKNTRLRQLPSFSLSATSPQLYSSTNDQSLDFTSIGLFAGISEQIRFDGKENEQIKYSEEDYKIAIKRAKKSIEEEKLTLKSAINELKFFNSTLRETKKKRSLIKELLSEDLSSENIANAIDQLYTLDEEINRLESRIIYQELEFWIWDESAWK